MFSKTLLLLCCLSLVACAHKASPPVPSTVDFVTATLGQAAEQAHGELALVAKLRGQGLQPLLPPPDPSLNLPVTISWTGSVDGALKEICLQLGYRYKEVGTPSAQVVTVVVRGLNRPAHELLEDLAWQVQPQAVLRVDPVNRVLTLARTLEARS
jgi:hypothetical protein